MKCKDNKCWPEEITDLLLRVMGVSFSSQERNIASWQGELLDEHGALIRKLAPAAKQ